MGVLACVYTQGVPVEHLGSKVHHFPQLLDVLLQQEKLCIVQAVHQRVVAVQQVCQAIHVSADPIILVFICCFICCIYLYNLEIIDLLNSQIIVQ